MRRPSLLQLALVAWVVSAGPVLLSAANGQDVSDTEDDGAERALDTSSPESRALSALLHVEPGYGVDGRVDLVYDFDARAELLDWSYGGFDQVQVSDGRLELSVGSQSQGTILSRLHLEGNYEVEVDLWLDYMTGRSELVFLLGEAGGVRFGSHFVQRTSRGFRALSGGQPSRETFAVGRSVTVRFQVADGALSAWIDGERVGSTTKLRGKLDGPIGFWLSDNMRVMITEIRLAGRPNLSKL